jgi:formylglycine-generating enzyme required for sulfatase activity
MEIRWVSSAVHPDEAPRLVSLRPFTLDPTAVTNGKFASFVAATAWRTVAETEGQLYSLNPAWL